MLSGRELIPWHTPFRSFSALRREMDELFSRAFGDWEQAGNTGPAISGGYLPPVQSYLKDQTLYLKADLPGVDPKDVEITVEGNQLMLRGERKTEHEGPEGNSFHREVRYGSFARSFPLPEGVKAEDVQANYRNGVLELAIPLPAVMLPKKVPIAVEGATNGQKHIEASK